MGLRGPGDAGEARGVRPAASPRAPGEIKLLILGLAHGHLGKRVHRKEKTVQNSAKSKLSPTENLEHVSLECPCSEGTQKEHSGLGEESTYE